LFTLDLTNYLFAVRFADLEYTHCSI